LALMKDYHTVSMEWDQFRRQKEIEDRRGSMSSQDEYLDNIEYAKEWSKDGIRNCDLVVFLLGRRFGFTPDRFFGTDYSITLQELMWAREYRKPIFPYCPKQPLDDEAEFLKANPYIRDAIVKQPVRASEYATEADLWRLGNEAGIEHVFWDRDEIATGVELIKRVRDDVDAWARRCAREIRVLYWTITLPIAFVIYVGGILAAR
jgi:hypothetical protein